MISSESRDIRHVYSQWLDGEVLFLNSKTSVLDVGEWDREIREWTRRLKLCLLFGYRFILSDVQVIDSRVVLDLFSDESFRTFIRSRPQTFVLISDPIGGHSEPIDHRRPAVLAGLQRSLEESWMSSTFCTPRWTKSIAVEVLDRDAFDVPYVISGSAMNAIREEAQPREVELLKGMLYGLGHFLEPGGAFEPARRTSCKTYFEILEEARDGGRLPCPGQLDGVVRFIEERLPECRRKSRSDLLRELCRSFGTADNRRQWPIWHYAVDAWNGAVQEHIAARAGGSCTPIRSSPGISYYTEEATFSVEIDGGAGDLVRRIERGREWFDFPDVSMLRWRDLGSVLSATEETCDELHGARSTGDAGQIQESIVRHSKAISEYVVARKLEYPPLVDGAIGVGVLAAGGGLVSVILGMGKVLLTSVTSTIPVLRRWQLGNTLTRIGGHLVNTAGGAEEEADHTR